MRRFFSISGWVNPKCPVFWGGVERESYVVVVVVVDAHLAGDGAVVVVDEEVLLDLGAGERALLVNTDARGGHGLLGQRLDRLGDSVRLHEHEGLLIQKKSVLCSAYIENLKNV